MNTLKHLLISSCLFHTFKLINFDLIASLIAKVDNLLIRFWYHDSLAKHPVITKWEKKSRSQKDNPLCTFPHSQWLNSYLKLDFYDITFLYWAFKTTLHFMHLFSMTFNEFQMTPFILKPNFTFPVKVLRKIDLTLYVLFSYFLWQNFNLNTRLYLSIPGAQ